MLYSVFNGFSVWINFNKHGDLVVAGVEGNDGLVEVLVHVGGVFLDFDVEVSLAAVEVLLGVEFFAFALGDFVVD